MLPMHTSQNSSAIRVNWGDIGNADLAALAVPKGESSDSPFLYFNPDNSIDTALASNLDLHRTVHSKSAAHH